MSRSLSITPEEIARLGLVEYAPGKFRKALKSSPQHSAKTRKAKSAVVSTPDAAERATRDFSSVTFTIPGQPIPKGRPRVMSAGHAFTPKRTVEYENKVRTFASLAMKGRQPLEFGVKVCIEFRLKGKRRMDWDNLAKAITDALNGLVYDDDSQIVEAHIFKAIGCDAPCAIVTVTGGVFGERPPTTEVV